MSANVTIPIPEWLDKICVWPLMQYRRLTFGEPFRKIDLGEGAYTIVDPDVYYEKCRYKWFLSEGTKAYPARTIKTGPEKARISYLHKELVKARKGKVVDHRDNDPFNNLRSNLRAATFSQNMMNRPKIKTKTTSQYRGVNWYEPRKRWRIAITYMKNGRSIIKHLGYTRDEIEAARIYDVAALKYHKEFAHTNFPREDYVKVGSNYKYIGDEKAAQNRCQKRTKIGKIYYSILSCFGKSEKGKEL
ncbi:MAG: HNH endonuclease [Sedimentisphaerales bacterium]|nr:HNH endonuclease [Sedimentisphaerales bacterium]